MGGGEGIRKESEGKVAGRENKEGTEEDRGRGQREEETEWEKGKFERKRTVKGSRREKSGRGEKVEGRKGERRGRGDARTGSREKGEEHIQGKSSQVL